MPKKSAKTIEHALEKTMSSSFYKSVSNFSTPKEAEMFFQHLFSPIEREMFIKRLAVVLFLDAGYSYQQINKQLHVSSATISSLAERVKEKSFQKMLRLLKAQTWADNWSKKLMKMVEGK